MLDFPRWKITSIVAFLVALMLLAVPSFFPEEQTAKWPIPHPRVNLGLDLAGGSYLLLEADTKDLASSRLEQMREQVLTEMRRTQPRIGIGDISIRGDRKRVVEGTSVSVRVDIGGRRIIKKKRNNKLKKIKLHNK